MDEHRADKIIEEIRLFLLQEPSMNNDFTGQITVHLHLGGISAGFDVNKRVKKLERVSKEN